MDGQDRQTPGPTGRFLGRSSSFSSSSNRASVPTPPPLSISRPNLIPQHWPPSHPGRAGGAAAASDPDAAVEVEQDPSDPPASACRRGQLAFFDRECSRVEDHLYLGSDLVARDREALRRHGITHVLNCVGGPELFSPDIAYKTLWLADNPSQDITSVLYDVFDYFEEVRCAAGPGGARSPRVLVHCSRGVSRSAALVVAYLMWRHSLPFDAALRRVRAARPVTDPNLGFASQLLSFQSRILPTLSSCSSLPPRCRLYRMAPQSPYDPLHLVPKSVDRRTPTPVDLDSRGAFVVHVPTSSKVYVWVGKDCDASLSPSAAVAAWQIVRYEGAAGPILTVNEGSETPDFWGSFGDSEGGVGGGGNAHGGLRRVSSYDLDFEIFGRAIKGGVVPPFQPVPSQPGSPTRLPAKEGGWGKLLAGVGVREPATCCRHPPSSDDRDLEPFGSPQSAVSPDLSTSPDYSTLSPTSTNSDWYNSSSPGSEICYDGEFLLPTKSSLQGDKCSPSSLSEPMEEAEEPESLKDWPFSPFRLSIEEETSVLDSDGTSPVPDCEPSFTDEQNDCCSKSVEPALFRWPSIEKVENMNPSVLDSTAVFLLLAPDSTSKKKGSKVLYVWVGGQCQLANDERDADDNDDGQENLRHVGSEFLRKMSYSGDIRIQVTREDEEPQQFLNHLFTFDQAKDVSKS